MEVSGEIEETGRNVTAFKKGDQVFCSTGLHLGAYGEYVCLPEDNPLVKKPLREVARERQHRAEAAHRVRPEEGRARPRGRRRPRDRSAREGRLRALKAVLPPPAQAPPEGERCRAGWGRVRA